jgi:hypothetical protein
MVNLRSIRRRGVTVVEGAVLLTTLLLILFAMLDLGLATFRYNMLAAAARQVGRYAIVRGAEAGPELSVWGPATYSQTAADGSEIAIVAAAYLATMDKSDVQIEVTWPDGENQENDRVVVRLAYRHQPVVPLLKLGGPMDLSAETTMQILH